MQKKTPYVYSESVFNSIFRCHWKWNASGVLKLCVSYRKTLREKYKLCCSDVAIDYVLPDLYLSS